MGPKMENKSMIHQKTRTVDFQDSFNGIGDLGIVLRVGDKKLLCREVAGAKQILLPDCGCCQNQFTFCLVCQESKSTLIPPF